MEPRRKGRRRRGGRDAEEEEEEAKGKGEGGAGADADGGGGGGRGGARVRQAAGLVAAGLYAATRLPVDAVPDVTNNQVQVLTQAPALSPLEVERFVTVPVELALKSLPDLVELRSLSRQGISVITVVFEEGVDTYFARQLILEQLRGIESELPPGTETPELGPVSTGLGEVFRYTLRDTTGRYSPMELRTIQDWIVRRQLLGVPGLAEVNSIGGTLKQYQVLVDPERLARFDCLTPS